MSARMPWFKCHPEKLLGAMAGMEPDEGYIYVTILLRIYETGGPIHDTARVLGRRTGLSERRAAAALASLCDLGKITIVDGVIDSPSTHETLTEMHTSRETAKKAGKMSAEKRSEKTEQNQQPDATTVERPLPSRSTIKEIEKEIDSSSLRSEPRAGRTAAQSPAGSEFDGTFWPAYPHKVGKPDAAKAFARARKSASLSEIMAGLDFYIRSKPTDRSWLNPSTFLNQERFRDQPAAGSQSRAPPDRPKSLTEVGLELIRNRHEQRTRNHEQPGVTIDAFPAAPSGRTGADGLFERDRVEWPGRDDACPFGPERRPAGLARQAG
jgi:hypothetical protein